VGWTEGGLLNFGKVILCVLIQDDLTNLSQWELGLWPDVGQVEDIDLLLLPKLLGLLRRHGLDVHGPTWKVSIFNGVVEILLRVVWRVIHGFLLRDPFNTLVGFEVDLSVDPLPFLVDEFEGVTAISVHVSVAIGDTTIAEKNHSLMNSLRILTQIVPEHGGVISTTEMGSWISLLSVDEVRELGGVSEEEDRCIVGDEVPVPFVSSELDGKTTRVSGTIMGSRFTTNSRESNGQAAFLSLLREHVGETEVWNGVCAFKVAVGSRTFGVDDTFWDPLSVEM